MNTEGNIDLLMQAIIKLTDFDFTKQGKRSVTSYTQEMAKNYRDLTTKWQKEIPVNKRDKTFFNYQIVWDLASDFGRLSGKFPRVQRYLREKNPGDLSYLVKRIDSKHLKLVPNQNPYAISQYEYPVQDVIASLDFAFRFLEDKPGIFVRGGFLLDGMKLHRKGTAYTNQGFISVSEDVQIAKDFIDLSPRRLMTNPVIWRELVTKPQHESILEYDRIIQIYDFRKTGVKSLWMPAVYDVSKQKIDPSLYKEREHLLPRGLRLRVRDRITIEDDDGKIHVEILEPV